MWGSLLVYVCLYSFVNVAGIKSSIRLHNLKKYTTYFVWISATTSVGTGPMSSKHTFSTAEDGEYIASFHICNLLFSDVPVAVMVLLYSLFTRLSPTPVGWGLPFEEVGNALRKIWIQPLGETNHRVCMGDGGSGWWTPDSTTSRCSGNYKGSCISRSDSRDRRKSNLKSGINRGYYMLARGYEFYLRVFDSISHEWASR